MLSGFEIYPRWVPLYPGQKLEQVTIQKGISVHSLMSVEVMLENTSVKQVIFVEMTPKAQIFDC